MFSKIRFPLSSRITPYRGLPVSPFRQMSPLMRSRWAIAGGCAALVRPVLALSRHNFPIHHPLVHLDDSHHIVHLDDARHALPTTYGSKTGHEGFVDALRVSGFPPASGLLPSAVFYDLPDGQQLAVARPLVSTHVYE